jgi:hypothetical protein
VGNLCRIDKVPEAEREILSEILLPKAPLSAQEFSRLGSYACLLLLAKQSGRKSTESDLFAGALALGGFGDELFTPVANGWTRYCARDAIAVTHECALSCMVNEITSIHARTGNGASPTTVIANLLGQVGDHNSALKDLGIIQGYETVSSLSYVEVRDRTLALFINEKPATPLEIRRWAHPLNEVTLYQRCLSAGAASVSLALIAWIMTAFRLDEESKLDTPESSWTSYQGNNRLGLSEIILPELNRFERDAFSFLEAAGELAMRTMSQHLQTAWSRLQVDVRRDVALISTEGNRWFPREGKTFYPGRTASRLSQAIGWMMQLNLIDNAGITPFGQAHLDRAKKTLSEGHCS